jgi:hypothetical protein
VNRGGWLVWAALFYLGYVAQAWAYLPLVLLFTAAAFLGNVLQDWLHLVWDGRVW